jgi:hypothetical protein
VVVVATKQSEKRPEDWDKLDKIRYLLDQWDAIWDWTGAALKDSGDGSGGRGTVPLPLMASHPSVVELGRCIGLLRGAAPGDCRHLMAFHTAEWRIAQKWAPRQLRSRKLELVEIRERERIVPRWLDMGRVDRAERWLVEHFRGEVFIPKDLWDALTKPIHEQAA